MSEKRRDFLRKGSGAAVAAGLLGSIAAPASSRGARKRRKQAIRLPQTPTDLPFSPVIRFGDLLFVSGQIAIDPKTRAIVKGGIQAETRFILERFQELLEAAGSSLDRVLKCTVFLTSASDFAGMNEAYRPSFPSDPPARSTVAVKELVVPGAHVEIECYAYVG